MLSQCRDTTQKSEQHTGSLCIHLYMYTYAIKYFAFLRNPAYTDFVKFGRKDIEIQFIYTYNINNV